MKWMSVGWRSTFLSVRHHKEKRLGVWEARNWFGSVGDRTRSQP